MMNAPLTYNNVTYLRYSDMITAYFIRLMPNNGEISQNAPEILREMIAIEDNSYGDISLLRTLLFKLFTNYATLYPASHAVLLIADEYISDKISIMVRFYGTAIYDYFTKCKLNSTVVIPIVSRLSANELVNFYKFYYVNRNENDGIIENRENLLAIKMLMIDNGKVLSLADDIRIDFYKNLPQEYQLGVIL